jgi:hypothetical protein
MLLNGNIHSILKGVPILKQARDLADNILAAGRHSRMITPDTDMPGFVPSEDQLIRQIDSLKKGDEIVVPIWSFVKDFEIKIQLGG